MAAQQETGSIEFRLSPESPRVSAAIVKRQIADHIKSLDLLDPSSLPFYPAGQSAINEPPWFAFFVESRLDSQTAPNVAPAFERGAFLERVYQVDAHWSSRQAVNLIIDRLDDLLVSGTFGDFQECDEILRLANVEKLSNSSIVSFLGITLAAKHKLSFRQDFFRRARHAVSIRRGDEGADKLLNKYR